MAYDIIFMDIDNTLLDFNAGTEDSLRQLLADFGMELTPARRRLFCPCLNNICIHNILPDYPSCSSPAKGQIFSENTCNGGKNRVYCQMET